LVYQRPQYDSLISDNDPGNTHTLTIPDVLANASVPTYYIFGIIDYTNPDFPDGNMITALSIQINGTSSVTNLSKTDWGYFGNAIRDVLLFFFYPQQDAINQLVSAKDDLLAKAPFGYFNSAQTSLNDLSYVATSSPSGNMLIKFKSTATTTLKLLDLSQTNTLVGSGSMGLIRNLAKYGLYLFFLVYLFLRIAHLFAPN